MSRKVEVNFTVVAGKKRIGKSNETLKELLFKYIAKLKRRALIYDPSNEYSSYKLDQFLPDGSENPSARKIQIGLLPHNKIAQFSIQNTIEIRRIAPIDKYGRRLTADEQGDLIIEMMDQFRNGCIFIEDLNKTFGDSLPDEVTGFLTNNAHRNCDVIFHVQDIGRLVPKIWQQTNIVRMHKMLDGVDKSKHKLGNDFEIFKIAENIVETEYRKGNIRYFVYIDRDEGKIKGAFTPEMFLKAVTDYIDIDAQHMVKRYTNKKDDFNKAVYTYAQAKQRVKTELFRKYYPAKF